MNRVAIAGSAVGSLAYGACFMFRLNRRLAMGISIGSGIIAAGAAAFYSLSKRRTDTKEQRAIEKLYNQHENFSALRQNWEQTMKSMLEEAERFMIVGKSAESVRCVSTAAALIALVHNEEKAESLIKNILTIKQFKSLEVEIQDEFTKDMDAVQCILSAELSELSPNVLDELKKTTKSNQLNGK